MSHLAKPKTLLLTSILVGFLISAWFLGKTAQQTLQQSQWVDYIERGNQAVEQQDYQQAFNLYQRAIQVNPDLPATALAGLGEIYFSAGQIEKSKGYYQQALEKDTGLVLAQERLDAINLSKKTSASDQTISQKTKIAFEFLQKEQPYLALPVLEQITKQAPKYRDGHYLLAAAFLKVNQKDKAQEEVEKALAIDPNLTAGQELKQKIEQIIQAP